MAAHLAEGREVLSENLQLVAAVGAAEVVPGDALFGVLRRAVSALPPPCKVSPLGLTEPLTRELTVQGPYASGIPIHLLVSESIDARLMAAEEVEVAFDVDSKGGQGRGQLTVCAPSSKPRYEILPPMYRGLTLLFMEFDDDFWAGYHFGDSSFASVYAEILSRLRRELRPLWLMDGGRALGGWREQRKARFLLYRSPDDFARWITEEFSVRGEPAQIVRVLHELAAGDVLTEVIYQRQPRAAELEAKGGPSGRYKRLRFDEWGGIVLEDGRFGWEPSSSEFWDETADDAKNALIDLLVAHKVAWRG